MYATRIITRHGAGSKLITDKGRDDVTFLLRNIQVITDTQNTKLHLSRREERHDWKTAPLHTRLSFTLRHELE